MKAYNIFLLILGLASYVTFISIKQPYDYFGNIYNVHIINGFTNNSSLPLVVWCSSGDTGDIGGRALQERDDFSWSVKTKFWKNSQYVCTMKLDQKRRRFQAFYGSRDVQRCSPTKQCFWLVKEDGFYFSNDEIYWQKDFSWI
ncbi:S-protein homolog 21 [Nicotiana tomentosiformis]|uniref:S-protein homolog n=1 Tax=Nicotiana tabacum TaxID=4097 RepID=A0A1S4ATR0_TOBAC|nr:S-protein homolog 6 [Nicotiana tomentosiformis]XP_016479893.1 PREDICTED: uncharacterized protein LOC107801124 [Nicotiana tabacum]